MSLQYVTQRKEKYIVVAEPPEIQPFKVPMSSPDINDADREAVANVLRGTTLSMGQETLGLEKAIAEYAGVQHAIAVSSGTTGLHLCVRAAGVEPGDLVITTPFSFVASSNVILYEQAIPVFVDVEPDTGNIDTGQLKTALADLQSGGKAATRWLPRKGTQNRREMKALLPVDVFGQPADFDPILDAAQRHGLKVIEDSCESLGACYKGRAAGTLGDYGVFAFYPNKQMTTGEGGMIITDDDEAAEFMRALRNQGRAPGDTWLEHSYLGYNYRITELSAALGWSQSKRLDSLIENRARVAGWYEERLAEIPGVEPPRVAAITTRMSWFVYVVRFAAAINRDEIISKLIERGIPSRPYFAPIHTQRYMVEKFGYKAGDYPVTEDLGARSLALPFSSVMTEGEVELVCRALRESVQTT